jgi:hypothetical protein
MVVTAKLASYRMPHERTIPGAEHKHLNKLDGVLPQPARAHKRAMKKFSAVGLAPRFCPHSLRYRHTFDHTVIGSAPMPIAARWPTVAAPGTESPASPRPPEPPTTGPINPPQPALGDPARTQKITALHRGSVSDDLYQLGQRASSYSRIGQLT